jgi:hypothetical protein
MHAKTPDGRPKATDAVIGELVTAVAEHRQKSAEERASGPALPKRAFWPLLAVGSAAFVALWGGWVGLGAMCGFGKVLLLPGFPWGLGKFSLDTAITLPLSMEAYGSVGLRYWLDPTLDKQTRNFARNSTFGALGSGFLAQAIYHVMASRHFHTAPAWVTVLVAGVPVAALALCAALHHSAHRSDHEARKRWREEHPELTAPAAPAAVTEPEPAAPAAPAGPEGTARELVAPAPSSPALVHVIKAADAGLPWGLAPAAAVSRPVPESAPQAPPVPRLLSWEGVPALEVTAPVTGPLMQLSERPEPKPAPRAPQGPPRLTVVAPPAAGARKPLPSDPEELRRVVSSMSRNKLFQTYDVSKHTADKLKKQLEDGTLGRNEEAGEDAVV